VTDAHEISGERVTTRLRRLIATGCVAMPGAYNALTARQIARAGFGAVYVSGAGLANATAGVPDVGLLSLAEVTRLSAYVAAAVDVPVLADGDTGEFYREPRVSATTCHAAADCPERQQPERGLGSGGAPLQVTVAETVVEFERAGVAGIHIEDQVFPKRCGHVAGKEVVAAVDMATKIRAAVAARMDPEFLIIVRTDARALEGIEAAVERARLYLDAGADAIFPEAMQTAEEFATFAARVDGPLMANMTEFGRGPLLGVKELNAMGYRMVIFPQTALRVAMRAQAECLRDLERHGTQREWLERMQTRTELYDLLGYDPEKEWKGW
jgi:methylisocitrate lyase